MLGNKATQGIMKAGLVIAAVLVVVRIICEQAGAGAVVNNIFGVAWLYFVIPVLFALKLRSAGEPAPFKALALNLVLFGIYTRIMVMVTYWVAYVLQWPAPRFSTEQGGNVGPGVDAVKGYLIIPGRNALIWVVFVVVAGMVLGGITLALKKKPNPAVA